MNIFPFLHVEHVSTYEEIYDVPIPLLNGLVMSEYLRL
jgi:hypothetical protein